MHEVLREAQDLFEYTRSLRRDFHRHPELGFQEVRTAGIVASELNTLGLEVKTGISKTGVVALLEGDQPGPVVLMRFDMDALPIVEETGLDYASQNEGVMHACGHDGHTAVGLTVARLLHAHRAELAGAVKLVFQPAEEGLGGAQGMVDEGVLEDPKPDVCLALHLWNLRPVGWLGISPGPVMAAPDDFHIHIRGKGGHGGSPELTVDPIVAAAHVVTGLQTLVSRNVPPFERAVVSVTAIKGGEAFNVIPQVVELKGTIRTFNRDVRRLVLERFRQLVEGVAAGFGCQADLDIRFIAPPVVNDSQATARVQEVASSVLAGFTIDDNYRTTISEDMSLMMQDIPGCYFFVGSANSEKGFDAAHHHPKFNIDEDILPKAAALMAGCTLDYLRS